MPGLLRAFLEHIHELAIIFATITFFGLLYCANPKRAWATWTIADRQAALSRLLLRAAESTVIVYGLMLACAAAYPTYFATWYGEDPGHIRAIFLIASVLVGSAIYFHVFEQEEVANITGNAAPNPTATSPRRGTGVQVFGVAVLLTLAALVALWYLDRSKTVHPAMTPPHQSQPAARTGQNSP